MEKLNCPNCGAPITGDKCEYCGTIFYDFANINIGDVSYIRMKHRDVLQIFRAVVTNVEIEYSTDNCVYFDNIPMAISGHETIRIEMEPIPDDRGILLEKRKRLENGRT